MNAASLSISHVGLVVNVAEATLGITFLTEAVANLRNSIDSIGSASPSAEARGAPLFDLGLLQFIAPHRLNPVCGSVDGIFDFA